MKIVNVMNFVRDCDFRIENSEEKLFQITKRELELVNQYEIPNTFLLQYDALIDPRYQELFKTKATEKTELGLWVEIVKPLTDAVGLPWRGRAGVTWDWHIVPGFLMAYTPKERELLMDEAMKKFKEVYGYYPRTIASWLLDSYSVEYLAKKYEISAFAICRDQTNTDAYTLVGGYFNQAYYPSKNNMFTPAQSAEYQVNTPIFRLLGSDPIHNYDNDKYISDQQYLPYAGCYTLEPVWRTGHDEKILPWFFKTYYANEDLGFSYAQLGQENSFVNDLVITGVTSQLEILKNYPEVVFQKMGDTGEWFKKTYAETPATCVYASEDWAHGNDIQSVYYDCKNYTLNLFRYKNKIFIRCWYLFDERIFEDYYEIPCNTWDATYENMPVVDTLLWEDNDGMVLDADAESFSVQKVSEGVLEVSWKDKVVRLEEEKITLRNIAPKMNIRGSKAEIQPEKEKITYAYKNNSYVLCVEGGSICEKEGVLEIGSEDQELILKLVRN